ncbi:unnamed protein product [Allacma fusca]|uniref:Uncharacterized protein n=1 Tax=Allacma fusca TaxID=39272 RepID=A0A8J2NNQ6_9HEXA|nr:unnamed protein product [Allacma fusca]
MSLNTVGHESRKTPRSRSFNQASLLRDEEEGLGDSGPVLCFAGKVLIVFVGLLIFLMILAIVALLRRGFVVKQDEETQSCRIPLADGTHIVTQLPSTIIIAVEEIKMQISKLFSLCLAVFLLAIFGVRAMPQVNARTGQRYAFGLDTSDGKYAPFNGPVKGLPPGHGGGRYGAADCLLCGK